MSINEAGHMCGSHQQLGISVIQVLPASEGIPSEETDESLLTMTVQAGPVVRLAGNVVEKDIGGLPCFFPVRIDKQ